MVAILRDNAEKKWKTTTNESPGNPVKPSNATLISYYPHVNKDNNQASGSNPNGKTQ